MGASWYAARKAERAWAEGVGFLRQGRAALAVQRFELAVRHDPSAADVWLGLHAAGHRQAEAMEAMSQHRGSFGALRTKHDMPLKSRFDLGFYVTFRLETARDLWLATMTGLLHERRLGEAWQSLAEAQLDCDETRFVCTRYAFLKQDWPLVLHFSRNITDAFLRDEAQLYVARALVEQHVFHEALSTLAPLPQALEKESRFEGEVAYVRGLAHEGLGREEEALRHFQYAFRCFPTLADVATRAQAVTVPAADVPAQEEPPEAVSTKGTSADPDAETRELWLSEAMELLDGMVGLEPVKRQLRTLVAQLRMTAVRREQGLPSSSGPQHFVFAGPPGTGKTTVARVLGKVFAGLGLLERGHVVETQRVDLVGRHLGETAIKTSKVIDSALGGLLFIDEAYALSNSGYSGGDAFGDEALQVLLKRAEDDRDRLVVVLAGYPDEINALLATNPGLASRFTTRVTFPSYSVEELVRIAHSFFDSQGDVLAEDATTALRGHCERAVEDGLVDRLGNGRFARELCRKAAALRDLRLYDRYGGSDTPTREEIVTVRLADVSAAFRELHDSAIAP
ncbi:AAA family ATPase [Streptomyces stelliscabiei]|uniref:Type VII secretion ATPase EccA n=1 Tax=Streptomyces stelliscabiei TaxID=146820 RepID=A0A8I0TTJ3_9ACTN|nr:AAA family ATPase [Streptomyces stelliscabiei]MBE1599076.1 type VII secretion ATPase EccA [Streptomyces stelliscabiei]MDX2520066.1 AAA family ATPase [Streptomyces stelliscabiei]